MDITITFGGSLLIICGVFAVAAFAWWMGFKDGRRDWGM